MVSTGSTFAVITSKIRKNLWINEVAQWYEGVIKVHVQWRAIMATVAAAQ